MNSHGKKRNPIVTFNHASDVDLTGEQGVCHAHSHALYRVRTIRPGEQQCSDQGGGLNDAG